MSDTADARLVGADQLARTLSGASLQMEDLREANRAVADQAAARARGMTPVLTGRLVSTVRATTERGKAVVLYGSGSVPYAGPIHWGWAARGITGAMFAYNATKEAADGPGLRAYETEIQKHLDKVRGA